MKKKLAVLLMMSTLILGSVSAYAGTKTAYLRADHGDATGSLTCNFKTKLFGSDSATASTKMGRNDGNYRVAVRLEGWDPKNMLGYKYASSSTTASVSLSYSDVDNFRSRHSIDNDNNSAEYEVEVLKISE